KIHTRIGRIIFNISQVTLHYLRNTPTYTSLLEGELAGHFGIPYQNRVSNVDSILQTIVSNMEVNHKRVTVTAGKFSGGLTVSILIKNFTDILSLPGAVVVTERGDLLEWLNWLLTQGDRIIIRNYEVDIEPGTGRSGLATMIPNDKSSWRVPPEFSGTINNNWLTRTLKSKNYMSAIDQAIQKELQ
ncbi:MAG: hypothetical protein R6V36_10040, partial [Psychroflexus sp.]